MGVLPFYLSAAIAFFAVLSFTILKLILAAVDGGWDVAERVFYPAYWKYWNDSALNFSRQQKQVLADKTCHIYNDMRYPLEYIEVVYIGWYMSKGET